MDGHSPATSVYNEPHLVYVGTKFISGPVGGELCRFQHLGFTGKAEHGGVAQEGHGVGQGAGLSHAICRWHGAII